MLSKAPPVPQQYSTKDSEEPAKSEGEDHIAGQLPNPAVDENPAIGGRVIEEVPEASVNASPGNTSRASESREIPARGSTDQVVHNRDTMVQKPGDDRLFTWAAVGLTIAIVVLLLKKFLKASEHGAVFMDGS